MSRALLIITIFMTSVFAGADVSQCFRAGNYKTGEIHISQTAVTVNYDIKDASKYSKESGRILKFENDSHQISFSTFLMGTGDGSDVQITLTSQLLIIQSLENDGQPFKDEKAVYKLKLCK